MKKTYFAGHAVCLTNFRVQWQIDLDRHGFLLKICPPLDSYSSSEVMTNKLHWQGREPFSSGQAGLASCRNVGGADGPFLYLCGHDLYSGMVGRCLVDSAHESVRSITIHCSLWAHFAPWGDESVGRIPPHVFACRHALHREISTPG